MPSSPALSDTWLRPFLASVISVGLSRVAYNTLSDQIGEGSVLTLMAILLSALIYFALCIVFGAVRRDDVEALLPKRAVKC